MKTIRNFFAVTIGVMGALLLAPFVAFFGLMMLGLAFGLSLMAAGAVTTWARTHEADETIDATAEPASGADTEEPQAA